MHKNTYFIQELMVKYIDSADKTQFKVPGKCFPGLTELGKSRKKT
jgi:hypothetical protein